MSLEQVKRADQRCPFANLELRSFQSSVIPRFFLDLPFDARSTCVTEVWIVRKAAWHMILNYKNELAELRVFDHVGSMAHNYLVHGGLVFGKSTGDRNAPSSEHASAIRTCVPQSASIDCPSTRMPVVMTSTPTACTWRRPIVPSLVRSPRC